MFFGSCPKDESDESGPFAFHIRETKRNFKTCIDYFIGQPIEKCLESQVLKIKIPQFEKFILKFRLAMS